MVIAPKIVSEMIKLAVDVALAVIIAILCLIFLD